MFQINTAVLNTAALAADKLKFCISATGHAGSNPVIYANRK